jgi:hypothetical protein
MSGKIMFLYVIKILLSLLPTFRVLVTVVHFDLGKLIIKYG